MNYIIAYDIADKKRLQKAHRYLRNIAVPLQNSLFLYTGSAQDLAHHFTELTAKLNRREDDVRVYPLHGKLYCFGKPSLPSGIYLADFPEVLLDTKDSFI